MTGALRRYQVTLPGKPATYIYADWIESSAAGGTVLCVAGETDFDEPRTVAIVTAASSVVDVSAMLTAPPPEMTADDARRPAPPHLIEKGR